MASPSRLYTVWFRMTLGMVVAGVWLGTSVVPSLADVIFKTDGRKLEGEILKAESTSTHWMLKTRVGKLPVAKADVLKVEWTSEILADYLKKRGDVANTADAHVELGQWCADHRLKEKAEAHFQKAIELDPDHGRAREALGYRYISGKWLTREDRYEFDGYVKYKGKYVLPQIKEWEETLDQEDQARKKWQRELRTISRWLKSRRASQAKSAISNIKDPMAASAILDVLGQSKEDDVRRLAIQVLGELKSTESTNALIVFGLTDPNEGNRAHAGQMLKERQSQGLINITAGYLRHSDRDIVRRAAALLGIYGDRTAIISLAEALKTKHIEGREPTFRERMRALSGGQAVIRPGGLTVGGQPKGGPKLVERDNPEVLAALNSIAGVNFGYDKARWFDWIRDEERKQAARLLDN